MKVDRWRPRHCTAIKRDGTPCRAWAVRGSEPATCIAHLAASDRAEVLAMPRSRRLPPPEQPALPELASEERSKADPTTVDAAPEGETEDASAADVSAADISAADISAIILDLAAKQQKLSKYIDECLDGGATVGQLTALFALHAQNASRLGRLLRDRLALGGDAGDELFAALNKALDELGQAWDVEL